LNDYVLSKDDISHKKRKHAEVILCKIMANIALILNT